MTAVAASAGSSLCGGLHCFDTSSALCVRVSYCESTLQVGGKGEASYAGVAGTTDRGVFF